MRHNHSVWCVLAFVAVLVSACGTVDETAGEPEAMRASASERWEARADLPYRTQEVYPALHDGRLFVAGGLSPDEAADGIGISDRVVVYDPETDRWSDGPSLPEPRHHPYLVSAEGWLFAFGGFVAANGGSWSASTDVLMLDEAESRWTKVADLLHPQSETVAGVIDGLVYLVTGRDPGGSANASWNDQTDIASVQVFDPKSYQVTAGPDAPTARNSAAGAVIDGKLYVVGGRVVGGGNLEVCEAFDPASGSWTSLAPMPNAQGGLAAAALGGQLYVFGGEYFDDAGGGVYEESWVYDPGSDSWRAVAPMPVPRHGLGAVAYGDGILVVAGAERAGGNETSSRLSMFMP
jgi:N-acetylneuraminic acid mutarotase